MLQKYVGLLLEFIRGIAKYEKMEDDGVELPELKPTEHRLLSVIRSRAHERMDCLSP